MDLLQQKLMKMKKKIIFRRGALVWTLEDLEILQGILQNRIEQFKMRLEELFKSEYCSEAVFFD